MTWGFPLMTFSWSFASLFRTVTKFLKSALKTPKTISDESSGTVTKPTASFSALQSRPSATHQQLDSVLGDSQFHVQISLSQQPRSRTDTQFRSRAKRTTRAKHRCQQVYTIPHSRRWVIPMKCPRAATSQRNRLDHRYPQYYPAQAKHRLALAYYPLLESSADSPPVRLRHFQSEKKGKEKLEGSFIIWSPSNFEYLLASLATNTPSSNNGAGSDSGSGSLADAPSKSNTDDHNEQYKRMCSRWCLIEEDRLIVAFS